MVVAAQQRPATKSRLEKGFLNIYFHFPPFFEAQVLNTSGTLSESVEGAWGCWPLRKGCLGLCYGPCEPQPLRPCPVTARHSRGWGGWGMRPKDDTTVGGWGSCLSPCPHASHVCSHICPPARTQMTSDPRGTVVPRAGPGSRVTGPEAHRDQAHLSHPDDPKPRAHRWGRSGVKSP